MDLDPERTVAANARRLRKDRGYSQQHVAELMTEAGYPTGEMPLWALEKGRRRIKVADLFGLAAALDVTPESLLTARSDSREAQANDGAQGISGHEQTAVDRTALDALELIFTRWKNAEHTPSMPATLLELLKSVRAAAADTHGARLLDCGFCYEEQGEEVHPHPECPVGKPTGPLVGFARIGLSVEPGFVDGVTTASWSKEAILSDADIAFVPNVEINGARGLDLKDSRRIFAGDEQAQIFVDDKRYATSSAHPVIVEPFGPGDAGAFVTLTLIADKVTVDGKEISE